eukprot:SAG31_NODE_16405_length_710_cov_1.163666_2_plen_94_part_01
MATLWFQKYASLTTDSKLASMKRNATKCWRQLIVDGQTANSLLSRHQTGFVPAHAERLTVQNQAILTAALSWQELLGALSAQVLLPLPLGLSWD